MATLGEIETDIRAVLNQDSSSVPDATITSAINSAIEYLATEGFWFQQAEQSYTLTIGDNSLGSDPTNFNYELADGGVTLVQNQQRYTLDKVSIAEYDNNNDQSTAQPLIYTRINQGFVVYPYPDAAYTVYLRYMKSYAALSTDGESNDFTNYAARAVKYTALADLFMDERKSEKNYKIYKQRAIEEINRLTKLSNSRRATKSLKTDGVQVYRTGRR